MAEARSFGGVFSGDPRAETSTPRASRLMLFCTEDAQSLGSTRRKDAAENNPSVTSSNYREALLSIWGRLKKRKREFFLLNSLTITLGLRRVGRIICKNQVDEAVCGCENN